VKPVILTTADIIDIPRGSGLVAKVEYAKQITAAGGIALGASSVPQATEYAKFADALLLTDGPIIHTSRYGDYDRGMGGPRNIDTQRDDLDIALCKAFMEAGKPILGIGRGAQIINVCLGGTVNANLRPALIIDGQVSDKKMGERLFINEPLKRLNHAMGNHTVQVSGSSLLPDGEKLVNSYHTNAVGKLAEGLKVTATSVEGTVEAFESVDKPWFGVQWHPEHAYMGYQPDTGLFEKFVEAAKPFAAEPRPRTACAAIAVNGGGALDPMFEERGWIMSRTYLNAVYAGGGLAVLTIDEDTAEEYAELADGLIMTGAFSWVPRPAVALKGSAEAGSHRTEMDKRLFFGFKNRAKPIYGICLGEQMMNLYSGGSLSFYFKADVHNEHMMSEHYCKADKGSLLNKLFGDEFLINSRHNNRVERVAEGFKVTARASHDDTIEAIEHETLPIYGFQFHPERTRGDLPDPPLAPDSTPLFAELMKMCLERRK